MINETKREAKMLVEGQQFNLFWPLMLLAIISAILAVTIIGSFLVPVVANLGAIYILKFIRNGERSFSSITDELKESSNIVLLIKASLRIFLYTLPANIVIVLFANLVQHYQDVAFVLISQVIVLAANIVNVILNIKFYFVSYIIKDAEYKITSKEAFQISNDMTYNEVWTIILFQISFILHFFLIILTFGIYLIWFMPYYAASNAVLYDKVKEKYLRRATSPLADKIRGNNSRYNPWNDTVTGHRATNNNANNTSFNNAPRDEFEEVEEMFANSHSKGTSHDIDPFDMSDNGKGIDHNIDPFDMSDNVKDASHDIDPFDMSDNDKDSGHDIDPFDNSLRDDDISADIREVKNKRETLDTSDDDVIIGSEVKDKSDTNIDDIPDDFYDDLDTF